MRFSKLFSIKVAHDYFENSWCNDVLIRPTAACNRLLKNYKLLFKDAGRGNFAVVTGTNDKGEALQEVPTGVSFDFDIVLLNPDFISYSKVPAKKNGETYRFSSKNTDAKNPFLLIADTTDSTTKNVGGKPVIGLVQIFCDGTFPLDYTVHFEAAEIKWKYYVVGNSNLKNLEISGSLAGINFSKNTTIDKKDKISVALSNNFPGANVFVFESKVPVGYSASGKKDIQLINNDKNNVLINHLPNPCYNENGIKIINIIN